jgi:sugar phosphate isomerase/epimerase
LTGFVDDIELVLFESGSESNLPSLEIIERLAGLPGLTYTVHFPIDRKLGSPDAAERDGMVGKVRQIMERVKPLPVHSYILHPEGICANAAAAEVLLWQRNLREATLRCIDGQEPARFALENLGFPFHWCDPLLDELPLAVCMDIGHLWRYGAAIAPHWQTYGQRVRVIHLHGERNGRDHISLQDTGPDRRSDVMSILAGFSGVCTLELFEYAAVAESIEWLRAAAAT